MKKIIIIILGLIFISNAASGLVTVYYGTTFYGDHLELSFATNGYNMSYLEVGNDYFNIDNMYLNMSGLSSTFAMNVSSHNGSNNVTANTVVLRFNATYTGTVSFEYTGNSTHNAVYSVYDYTDGSSILSGGSADSIGKIDFDITFASEHDIEIELDYYLPDPPYNGASDYTVNQKLNLSWSRGNYSDREVLVRKSGSYPSSSSDGTEVQNDTALFYNETITNSGYYTVWSYNDTTGSFSSTGLNIPWGAIGVNCFNETTPSQAIGFNLEVSNYEGTIVYQQDDLVNTHYIDLNDIPYGSNTVFIVSNSSYKQRVYYKDISLNQFLNYSFYLPPITTSGGGGGGSGDENDTVETSLYYLRVIETITLEYNEVDRAVEGATVNVKRYINTTGVYENVSTLLTDANGYVNLYLIPYQNYKVIITKDGYETKISDYIPQPPNIYGQTEVKPFRIIATTESTNETDVYLFWDNVTFTATMMSNNTLYIVYDDSLLGTIDTQVYIYEFYNGTLTLVDDFSYIGVNSFIHFAPGLNSSRMYYVDLFINHSMSFGEGFNLQPLRIIVYPIDTSIVRLKFDLESRIESMFGPGPLGPGSWCPFIVCLVSLGVLVSLGPFHVGFAIMLSGLVMSIISIFFGIWLTNLFPIVVTAIVGFVIAIGIGYILVKQPKEIL